jgi:hypothetical protein
MADPTRSRMAPREFNSVVVTGTAAMLPTYDVQIAIGVNRTDCCQITTRCCHVY